MRTLKDLFDMMGKDKEMKKKFLSICSDEKEVEKFLKKYDCDATVDEIRAYGLKCVEKQKKIPDEIICNISGGKYSSMTYRELGESGGDEHPLITTAGNSCGGWGNDFEHVFAQHTCNGCTFVIRRGLKMYCGTRSAEDDKFK